jgi:hypothetical protein
MLSLASRLTVVGLAVAASTLSMSSVAQAAPKPHMGNPTASCVGLTTSEHAVNDGGRFVAAQVAEVRASSQRCSVCRSVRASGTSRRLMLDRTSPARPHSPETGSTHGSCSTST